MKSSRVSTRRRRRRRWLLLSIAVVTFGLAWATEGASSEDGALPRSLVASSPSPPLPPRPPSPPPSSASSEGSNNEEQVLFECRHSDYRTYIKCLKRQKRHHWQQRNEHETSEGGEPRRCFDECGLDDCESTKCVHECHKRCMKKTKETRQIITQYETTCLDGNDDSEDCGKKTGREESAVPPATTNVTTNIDINNVINNHRESQVPCGTFGCDDRLSLVPQLQLVPQITFGLGIAFGTNFQQGGGIGGVGGGVGVGPRRVDCSLCANPWMRYRCDVSCYSSQDSPNVPKQPSDGTSAAGIPGANCILPYCVGGGSA